MNADVAEERRHEGQREVAEDDGGNAGEQLQRRLQGVAGAGARVLAEEDRRAEAGGDGDEASPEGDGQRPREEREDPELRLEEERRPFRARDVIGEVDFLEELERRCEERDDDSDCGRDGDKRAEGEDGLDKSLAPPLPRWGECQRFGSGCDH